MRRGLAAAPGSLKERVAGGGRELSELLLVLMVKSESEGSVLGPETR